MDAAHTVLGLGHPGHPAVVNLDGDNMLSTAAAVTGGAWDTRPVSSFSHNDVLDQLRSVFFPCHDFSHSDWARDMGSYERDQMEQELMMERSLREQVSGRPARECGRGAAL